MSASDLDKWRSLAATMPGGPLAVGMPLATFLGEAIAVAKFHRQHWKARRDRKGAVVLPGLELAVHEVLGGTPLSRHTGAELRSLHAAVRHADELYQLARAPSGRAPLREAKEVLRKLRAALAWALHDPAEPDARKLATLAIRHAAPRRKAAIASALEAHATLADHVHERLGALALFDCTLPTRARTLAARLREGTGPTPAASRAAREALALRNRVCRLLQRRMQLVRDAARVVFHDHPELHRAATSRHARRTRAATRRRTRTETSTPAPRPLPATAACDGVEGSPAGDPEPGS